MPDPISVSALTLSIQQVLGSNFGPVSVQGELTQFLAHRSGHWYFTLKDPGAVLNCVMFRNMNQLVRQLPEQGSQVVVMGELNVYGPQGRYNLVARRIEAAGQGEAAARLERLRRRLQEEGLFDPARKRPLPALPRAVGVATSPTGAAFQDILKVLDRRFPGLPVYLAPCRVQGEGAAAEIARALHLLGQHPAVEVIIVGRGGGSAEDLAAFNEEELVRAVVASPVPVVSGVGHEVDFSLCDLAADLRAATPSHAAELVVPERAALLGRLEVASQTLASAMARHVQRRRVMIDLLPLRPPRLQLRMARQRLEQVGAEGERAMVDRVEGGRRRWEGLAGRLAALSPRAVLGRGYAIVEHEGRTLKDTAGLPDGARLELHLAHQRAVASLLSVPVEDSPTELRPPE